MMEYRRKKMIRMLQNPQEYVVGDYKSGLAQHFIDHHDLKAWIQFEDRFSIENNTGMDGSTLNSIVNFLCVINGQAGIASTFMAKVEFISREKMLSLYSRYSNQRVNVITKDIFNNIAFWLYKNNFISELEFHRLSCYKSDFNITEITLDDFNHFILNNEITRYVETPWGK